MKTNSDKNANRLQGAVKQKRLIIILAIILCVGLVIISGLIFVLLKTNKASLEKNTDSLSEDGADINSDNSGASADNEKSTEGELKSDEYIAGLVCFGDGPTTGGESGEGYASELRSLFEERAIPIPVFSQGKESQNIESLEAFINDLQFYPNCIPVFYLKYGSDEELSWNDFLFRLSELAEYSAEFPKRFLIIGSIEGNIADNICYDYAFNSEFGDNYLNFRDYLSAKGTKMEIFDDDASRSALNFRSVPEKILESTGVLNNDGYKLLAQAVYEKLDTLGYLYKNDRNLEINRSEAFEYVKTIGPGISLSGVYDEVIPVQKFETPYDIQPALESFESIPSHMIVGSGSEVWQNEISEELLELIDDAGFRTIRIPVGFYSYRTESGEINQDFLDELKYITKYYLDLDANNRVIISGINDSWNYLYYDNYYRAGELSYDQWSEIAEAFKEFDDRLMFEGYHRLSLEGTVFENSEGTEAAISVINSLQENFVKAVRDSGGNNAERYLILDGYGLGAMSGCFTGLNIPLDEHLILSATGFMDYKFCTNPGAGFDDSREVFWDLGIESLMETAKKLNLPLIITELGSVNKGNEQRLDFVKYAVSTLRNKDIPYLWFDNGVIGDGADSYGIIDRSNNEFYYTQTAVALLY